MRSRILLKRLKKKKQEYSQPLMEEESPVDESELHSSPGAQLVLTNVPLRSWIPRLVIGLALFFGALVVLGLRPAFWNIGLVMSVLGVFFIFKTKKETYVFDQVTGQFIWTRRTLLNLERREYWLSDIQSVQLVELSDGQGGLDTNLYLVFSSGSRIKIFSGQLIVLKDRSRVKAKEQIEEFLRLCEAPEAPSSPQTSVAASPLGKGGMQRHISQLLERGSSRGKFPSPLLRRNQPAFHEDGSDEEEDAIEMKEKGEEMV